MMGVAVLYLHEQEDGQIHISAEIVGECENASVLLCELIQTMTMLDGVQYNNQPIGIAANPTASDIQ
jgi:hypothetical protein